MGGGGENCPTVPSSTHGSFKKKFACVSANINPVIMFQMKGLSPGVAYVTLVQTSLCGAKCDGVEKSLIVKPSGSQQTRFVTKMITSSGQSPIVFPMPNFDSLPPVGGSVKSYFSIIGDIMGPTMQNLDRLIVLPSGCGEQNMIG